MANLQRGIDECGGLMIFEQMSWKVGQNELFGGSEEPTSLWERVA